MHSNQRLVRSVPSWCVFFFMLAPAFAQLTITSGPNYGTWSVGEIQTALTATGGNGTYAWAVISGNLPSGVAVRTDVPSFFPMGTQAGLIGVATTPGTYNFTVQVTSNGQSVSQSASVKVTALT